MGDQETKRRRRGGYDAQPQHVVAHRFPEYRLSKHLLIVRKTDKRTARIAVGERQAQCFENRVDSVDPYHENDREDEQPRPDHVGAIDVSSGVLAARREQDFVEQLVGEVEVTEATADTADDEDETLDCYVQVRAPP